MTATVLIALGSNRRHGRHGRPRDVLEAAIAALAAAGLVILARSAIHATAPVGPGTRRFANAVIAAQTELALPALLALLQALERDFGRRRGRRWGDRVLDLDLLAAGAVVSRAGALLLPHPRLHQRRFVLDPLVEVAPGWRHPRLAATARQLRARAMRPKGRGVGLAAPARTSRAAKLAGP